MLIAVGVDILLENNSVVYAVFEHIEVPQDKDDF